MSPRNSVIALKNVSKHFGGIKAVEDVSFKVSHSEIVGYVGPNGAGKTTLISLLMGFLRPTAGEIYLFGDPIKPETAHTHHLQIGYIAGDMAMPPLLTGRQYLEYMASLTRRNDARQKQLVKTLSPVLDQKIKTLSRGNKQKVALIGALQHEPKLILLDEPTSGLDPLMQSTFIDIIHEAAGSGATVFMSSHILSEVTSICDRVMFMKQGSIILDSAISDIESQSGKVVTIRGDKKSLVSLMRRHPAGLSSPETSEAGTVTCLYKGDVNALMKWVAGAQVEDVQIRDRDFESIFHEMYDTTATKKGGTQ